MVARNNIEAIYQLSPQQEGMLVESLRSEGADLFIEQEIHTLPGYVDREIFQRVWMRALQRHPILRTAFVWKSRHTPLQIVLTKVELPIVYLDWRGQTRPQQDMRLSEYLAEDRRHGFDLSSAPLIRLGLIRTEEDSYTFVWTQHHILFDGWSRAILLQELMSMYEVYARGKVPPDEKTYSYELYIDWLKKQDMQVAEAFWRHELEGFYETTSLGTVVHSGARLNADKLFAETDITFSRAQVEKLENAARGHRTTISSILHGIWALLLSRYSGNKDVVFGSTVSGRPMDLPNADLIIGLFINTLPIRVQVDSGAEFWSWLNAMQSHHLEVRHFEYCSAGQIHQWSQVPGSVPLYESMLVVENYPIKTDASMNASSSGRFIGARTTHALTLLASSHAGLIIRAVYNTSRLSQQSVEQIAEHIRTVLLHIAEQEQASLAGLLSMIPQRTIPQFYSVSEFEEDADVLEYVPPRTPLEKKVIGLVSEVLGVERIGMKDRFFKLGGHSLLATQFIARVRKSLQVELPMRSLFESADMQELVGFIEAAIMTKIENLSETEAQLLIDKIT